MVHYMEVWLYVDDGDVPHWKEEWETMDDAEFMFKLWSKT